jgi:hypothetical protein
MSVTGSSVGVNSSFCSSQINQNCPDLLGCFADVCPDFVIKRHDTKPPFRVMVDDCDGALDLSDSTLVLEANMWSKAKLKSSITIADDYFALADNIGFDQLMVGDIIIMDRVRLPEHMLVVAFDETNKFVQVSRGYNGTLAQAWKKGTGLRIFRTMSASASIELVNEDLTQEDGTVKKDQLTGTFLVYDWQAKDTCTPGCFFLEFKLLKMQVALMAVPSITPSFTPSSFTPDDFGCSLGEGVEWARRFPSNSEGFFIKVVDSPSAEI